MFDTRVAGLPGSFEWMGSGLHAGRRGGAMAVGFVPRRSGRNGIWAQCPRPGDTAAGANVVPSPRTEGQSAPLFEPRRPASPEAASLLTQAWHGLADAAREITPSDRFIASYLSALRAGAAILVAKGRPHRRAAKPQSTWTLLASAAPEVAQWAEYFAARSTLHAAAQSGLTRRVGAVATEELRHRAEEFVALAARVVHGDPGEPEPRAPSCGARSRTRPWRGEQ